MEKTFTVATFNEQAPAEQLSAKLREAGFDADMFDESQAQKWLLMNLEPKAHMRVRVPNDQGERALQTLADWKGKEPVLAQAVECPQCHSSRIEYPQFSRRTLMSAFQGAAAAAGIIDRQYYCEACGFTWEADPKPEQKKDILNWPEGTQVP